MNPTVDKALRQARKLAFRLRIIEKKATLPEIRTPDETAVLIALLRRWRGVAEVIEHLCETLAMVKQQLRDQHENNAELARQNVELSRQAWEHHATLSARIQDLEDELEAYHTAAPVP